MLIDSSSKLMYRDASADKMYIGGVLVWSRMVSLDLLPHGSQLLSAASGTWTCPPGVTSVNVVLIGRGASGYAYSPYYGGGGGALVYKNNIPVVPGQQYAYTVGGGGNTSRVDTTIFGLTAGQGNGPNGGIGSLVGDPDGAFNGGNDVSDNGGSSATYFANGAGSRIGVSPHGAYTHTSTLYGIGGTRTESSAGGFPGVIRIVWGPNREYPHKSNVYLPSRTVQRFGGGKAGIMFGPKGTYGETRWEKDGSPEFYTVFADSDGWIDPATDSNNWSLFTYRVFNPITETWSTWGSMPSTANRIYFFQTGGTTNDPIYHPSLRVQIAKGSIIVGDATYTLNDGPYTSVPYMTSATTPSGVVDDSAGSASAFYAFSDIGGYTERAAPMWISYDFGYPVEVTNFRFKGWDGDYNPFNFRIEYYDPATSSWKTAYAGSMTTVLDQSFEIPRVGKFSNWRFYGVNDRATNLIVIDRLFFNGPP